MRGGLFLFPLYVDPQDASAADAREEVYPVGSQPAAHAEAINPQRLATLIRSSTTGRLSSADETTEIDADVLNSLPKWAQAVVQTGCFDSGAVHGPKPSPRDMLKRKSELQEEQDCEQPRKRRSFGNGLSTVNPIKDENGELQDCLDELNAEPDVDVEMDDEDELPIFSTQAEIAADSVEKYADLLEGLLEKATQRQGLENFESDNLDVFSPQEVKLLLQTMKTLEKNDWVNGLEPAILIALMSTLDVQVRLGLAVDVLGAALPNGEEGKPQQSKTDRGLVSSILTSLDVAICELIVMTRPDIDRRVLSEENLENCFQLLHHITRRLILPCIDTTYVTTASTPIAEEKGRRRLSGAKMSSSSRVNLRVNKHIRKAVDQVSHVFCEFMDHLAALVLSVKLADRWVLPLSAAMVELFALEHSPYATSLQQSALTILRAVFKQYKSHRDALLEDIVAVMVKLPTTKRTLRTVKLASSSDSVQQISTLVVSMIQSCIPAAKLEAVESDPVFQESSETPSTPDTVSEEKPLKMDVAEAALGETRNSAQSLVRALLKACWKKNEDRDNRVVLENFVEDLLVMFVRPEWIGAEDVLEALCSSLASVLHANISADERNPDSHKSLAALNLVGKVCAAIKRYQKKVDHGAVVDDSDSTAVVEEHKSCLREAIVGKKTRSRKALPSACSDLVDLLAFKHIVVMHLQRKGSDQCDSRKLLLLKFMSEAKTHWSDIESACMDREYTLWKTLVVETKGATNSTFKVAIPTTELALRASLHLAVKRRFCGLFDGLLVHIMALLSRAAPTLRARVMKCLRGIVDVDPMLMAESGVRSAVQRCCSDEKPSVREAAVDLIGTYVLLQPLLFDKYFDVLAERMRDKGIKVRKSVCKIFKIALTAMQEKSHDVDSEQELRRKSACMRCLVERVGDASEDQGVKNFIIDTFQEVWFGSELSSSKLSNPLSEFGDGSTLPPGWTAVAIEDKSEAPEVNSKYVSEDGVIVNSVEEAWSSYRTPMVTPASVVKINDAKMDNSSEVVATIVEVIHGMPNLGWFAELLKRLLRGRSNGTRETAVRSVKNRSAEIAIAEDRSEKIVDRLVNCLMDLQEGTLLIGVSIKVGHEQFVACMTALSVFCEAKPELLTRHLETIRVYLKEKDAMILNLSVSMIDSILRVKRVSLSIASRLEEDLKYLILHSPPSVVGPSVKCLATLSKATKKAPALLLQLLEFFFVRMRQHKQIESLSSLSEEDNRALQRALFVAGKIVGATDMDNIQELVRETTVLQIGTITASLYELYKPFICAPDNDKCSAMAVQGMGFLFPIRPRLFLRAQQDGLLKHLLTPPFPEKKTKTFQCLVSMKELLLSEEQRLENGMASRSMDRSKSKEQQVQGDQEADASLIGSVMQAELDSILLLSVQKIPQIRKEAVACIGALLTQGLVNPLQCIQNLVALETDRVSDVRDAAFSQLLALYKRFRSEIHTPLIKGIHGSYSFQLGVYGNVTALGIDDNKKEYCLFGRLYSTCLKPTKSHGSLLLKSLINQFTDQGSVLKPLKSTLATDNNKNFTSRLKYLSYLAQIISTLPYDVEDEPLYVIYLINQYASLRLGPVLDDMKEVFATAGVAPQQLEDEAADLSKINIDEYRPLGSLPRFKLAALKTNGCIAFALALTLRLKFALKRNYQLDNEKCATYKPSSRDPPVEARERSPKKLLLPSVDDLCQTDDPIELSWNLFMTAWLTARKDERQLDIDLQGKEKLKASPKRRRRSRKVVARKQQHSSENDSNEDDEFVDGFA